MAELKKKFQSRRLSNVPRGQWLRALVQETFPEGRIMTNIFPRFKHRHFIELFMAFEHLPLIICFVAVF